MKALILLAILSALPCSAQIEALLKGELLAHPLPPEKNVPGKEIRVGLEDLTIPYLASSRSLADSGFLTFSDLVNITDQTSQVTIVFVDAKGDPMDLPLATVGPNGRIRLECTPSFARGITATLEPGESRQQIILPAGPTFTGWAGVVTQPSVSSAVTATFMQIVPALHRQCVRVGVACDARCDRMRQHLCCAAVPPCIDRANSS